MRLRGRGDGRLAGSASRLARANWRALCGHAPRASAAPSRRCRCQSSGRSDREVVGHPEFSHPSFSLEKAPDGASGRASGGAQCCRIFDRKVLRARRARFRVDRRSPSRVQSSTILPASMKITRWRDFASRSPSRASRTIMVMPSLRQLDHHVEHLADHLGVERRGRLVEQHHDRVHAQRAGDRDALLLPARQLSRELVLVRRSGRHGRASSTRARLGVGVRCDRAP